MNVGKALRSASGAIANFADSVSRMRAVQEAMAPARCAFETEKMLLSSALRSAEGSHEIDAKRRADPKWAAQFDAALEEISSLFDERAGSEALDAVRLEEFRPPSIPDRSIARQEITAAFEGLRQARASFFSEIRAWATANPSAAPHAVEFMREAGFAHLWFEAVGADASEEVLEPEVEDELSARELLLEMPCAEDPALQEGDDADHGAERTAAILSGPANGEFWRELDRLKSEVWSRLRHRLTRDQMCLGRDEFCEEARPLIAEILDEIGVKTGLRWTVLFEGMVADDRYTNFSMSQAD